MLPQTMAQNLIVCQLCEKSKEIKWKCFNCDLVLCQKCASIHSKFSGSEEHCIIDLKQVGTPENLDIIRKYHLKNIFCLNHKKEKCSLFCKDCKIPVCSFCVIKPIHKGHNLEKLSTVYNTQLSELEDIKQLIKENLSGLSKSVRESATTSDNYNEIKQKIIQREREIKEKATKDAAILIDELDKLIIPSKDAFMEEKQRIQDREIKLKETYNEVDAALNSHQPTSVLSSINKVEKCSLLKMNLNNIPLEQNFKFIVPDLKSINFGSVKKCPILKVIKTYETKVPYIINLKSLKDGTLVCIYKDSKLQPFIGYCDEQGDNYIITNEIHATCFPVFYYIDMTITEDDLILIANGNDQLTCMKEHDKKLQFFELSNLFELSYLPEEPTYTFGNGIHSFDQTILLGFEEYDGLEEYPCQLGGVMIFDKSGHHLQTFMKTEDDSDLCCLLKQKIMKLTTNTNGDIIIMDKKNLSIFDSNFKLKRTYEELHSPNDIVTTPNGLIVVSDTNSVDVLSMDGDCLTSIGELEGINRSTCVHIDKKGQLVIGCKGQENENAKVHVVKICN
ncbi:uncharacterized protein [Mytilus edulis]|uniref:uncharacterized protein n=1 Tax=Mytilus edulis TaxID=6550 RepID=UPI0039F12349